MQSAPIEGRPHVVNMNLDLAFQLDGHVKNPSLLQVVIWNPTRTRSCPLISALVIAWILSPLFSAPFSLCAQEC
jgi:hypothetical protein